MCFICLLCYVILLIGAVWCGGTVAHTRRSLSWSIQQQQQQPVVAGRWQKRPPWPRRSRMLHLHRRAALATFGCDASHSRRAPLDTPTRYTNRITKAAEQDLHDRFSLGFYVEWKINICSVCVSSRRGIKPRKTANLLLCVDSERDTAPSLNNRTRIIFIKAQKEALDTHFVETSAAARDRQKEAYLRSSKKSKVFAE